MKAKQFLVRLSVSLPPVRFQLTIAKSLYHSLTLASSGSEAKWPISPPTTAV